MDTTQNIYNRMTKADFLLASLLHMNLCKVSMDTSRCPDCHAMRERLANDVVREGKISPLPRIVAMCEGELDDASCIHLELQDGVDLETEKKVWGDWGYRYIPGTTTNEDFIEMLKRTGKAKEVYIETYWNY